MGCVHWTRLLYPQYVGPVRWIMCFPEEREGEGRRGRKGGWTRMSTSSSSGSDCGCFCCPTTWCGSSPRAADYTNSRWFPNILPQPVGDSSPCHSHAYDDNLPSQPLLSSLWPPEYKGATNRILEGAWIFFFYIEINIVVEKMGEIYKWPQGMVEIQPILR